MKRTENDLIIRAVTFLNESYGDTFIVEIESLIDGIGEFDEEFYNGFVDGMDFSDIVNRIMSKIGGLYILVNIIMNDSKDKLELSAKDGTVYKRPLLDFEKA